MSQQNTRLTLESDDEDAKFQQSRRGKLKIDSTKSQFTKAAIQNSIQKERFEEQADLVFNQMQDKNQRAAELVKEFWSFVMDQTLLTEKGPARKSLEKEIVNKLLSFATEINNDPNEFEGAGSVAIISLLLKAVLYLRDINSGLSYRLSEVEKQIKKMSSQLSVTTNLK